MSERTLAILKPDVVRRNLAGAVLHMIESSDLRIIALRMIHMTQNQAAAFYAVHKERPFFTELCQTMVSGPVVVCVLEGKDAMSRYRTLMGSTNPAQAAPGTIRAQYALSIGENSVHGSDSLENAKIEITHFFSESDIVNA